MKAPGVPVAMHEEVVLWQGVRFQSFLLVWEKFLFSIATFRDESINAKITFKLAVLL